MDSFTPLLVVLAVVAIAVLVVRVAEARSKLPRYPWSMHCDTCDLRLSTDDQLFRDRMLREHVLKGHDASAGWVV